MTSARRLAHLRLVAAGLAVALPLLLPVGARWLAPGVPAISIAVGAVSFVVGAAVFFYAAFRWRPRCPRCADARATFVRSRDEDEYLACASCGFREATGYTFRG